MADQTTTPEKKPPTRAAKLAGMVGEALTVRSPILGQLRESVSALTEKPEKGETRLGNVLGALKQSAVNNSAILRQFVMLKDAITSIVKEDRDGKAPEKAPKTQTDKKTEDGKAKDFSTAIIEYLDNKENPYYVMMKSDNNYLEQIVTLLKQQSEIMKENMQIAQETRERSETADSLKSVSRSDAARARTAQQPRDELGRFVKEEPKTEAESGGLSQVLDTMDDALDVVKNLKKYKEVIAAGFATAVGLAIKFKNGLMSRLSGLGKGLKGLAAEMKPLAKGFASKVGSLIDDAGKTAKGALPGLKKYAGKGLSYLGKGLGMAARVVGSTAFGAAMGILDPSDLGDDTLEGTIRRNYADELRAMGFDPETGVAESPEAEAKARAFIEEKIKTGQFVPEGGLLPEQQEAIKANRQRLIDQGYNPDTGEPVTDEARARLDKTQKERQEREEQDRRMRTTQTPPDLTTPDVRLPSSLLSVESSSNKEILDYLNSIQNPPIVGSAPMTRMQDYLSFMGNAAQPRPAQTAQAAAPVIVNNQGGPTSVNNGGNVTNIITGGSSLMLPQLAFNLPTSLS